MAVEDLHWSDPSTLETLGLIAERLGCARFLLLLTARPEFESPWRHDPHVTSLALGRLGRADTRSIVSTFTAGVALPQKLLEEIVAKTDGVPLFAEELTKSVLEARRLEPAPEAQARYESSPDIAIPATLRDSLTARLDRLGDTKEIAQSAATIGRTFSRDLLSVVTTRSDPELQAALRLLAEAELVYPMTTSARDVYQFKHALIQEAAYASLLKSTRKDIHLRIAKALQENASTPDAAEPEMTAHHLTEGGAVEPAIVQWHRAAQRAASRSANAEAVAHASKGLELIGDLPGSEYRTRLEVDLLIAQAVPRMVLV